MTETKRLSRTTLVVNKIKDRVLDSCIGLQVPERRSPKLPEQLTSKIPTVTFRIILLYL